MQQTQLDIDRIHEALSGTNSEQQRIAEIGLGVIATLLRKNSDYGSSAWQSPILKQSLSPSDAILVRMSDKIARLQTLERKNAEVSDESITDTIKDLSGYSILWIARPPA